MKFGLTRWWEESKQEDRPMNWTWEKLKEYLIDHDLWGDHPVMDDIEEALKERAAEIERLREENERLRQAGNKLTKSVDELVDAAYDKSDDDWWLEMIDAVNLDMADWFKSSREAE